MRLINRHPDRAGRLMLVLLPFALLLFAYFTGSASRLAENPNDKLLPSAAQMVDAVERLAFTEDKRSGAYLFWQDSASSLKRLGIGLSIAALTGLALGIAAGTLPLFGAPLSPLLTVLSMVPPLAILPILFIVFGLGELSKVMLIVIGVAPMIARDLEQRAREIPLELLIKAQTLGASTWTLILRVVLPQLLPRLLISLRLVLGSAWLFLIAAEAIASTDGLGYRIFLVRRYLAMDVILPYVVWITLLAWLMDLGLRQLTRLAFPWYEGAKA
ncbi:ABC transporter permease [Metapseudomonas furukawaii]|uniref:Urea carboxylase-related ABC transporter n=1 Tax=Metapseudomonas furukawaii TaxID=1149133 RepID=A0AAD1BXD1_METFU|nr:ABC transporter permease subunit [Pseudomonas furukawaii]ELS27204.1 Urea carboxylase-related ABC transporter, permease protein [Pseudomonas furukawaii]BAU72998.1 urea carboxylase-related ABC transporter [Pseudomonas furukawaii]